MMCCGVFRPELIERERAGPARMVDVTDGIRGTVTSRARAEYRRI